MDSIKRSLNALYIAFSIDRMFWTDFLLYTPLFLSLMLGLTTSTIERNVLYQNNDVRCLDLWLRLPLLTYFGWMVIVEARWHRRPEHRSLTFSALYQSMFVVWVIRGTIWFHCASPHCEIPSRAPTNLSGPLEDFHHEQLHLLQTCVWRKQMFMYLLWTFIILSSTRAAMSMRDLLDFVSGLFANFHKLLSDNEGKRTAICLCKDGGEAVGRVKGQ